MNQSVTFSQASAPAATAAVQASPMGYWQKVLTILLVVQILLAIAVFAWERNAKPELQAQPLLATNAGDADKIIIRDANASVTLLKVDGSWQLPDLQNLPADTQKLTELLDKLKGTKLTWPVTTSKTSHERFEVSDGKFQRRVEWYQGDSKLDEVLLGTSPGFKKVHLRKHNDEAVYAVQLNSFEFATGKNDWLKKDLLAVAAPQQITGGAYSLQKSGDNWGFASGVEKLDAAKASELANAFSSLQIMEPVAEIPQGEKHSFTVKGASGDYQFEFVSADNNYFVKRTDIGQSFKLSQYEFERIVKLKKEDLLAKAAAEPATTDPINQAVNQATQGLLNNAN